MENNYTIIMLDSIAPSFCYYEPSKKSKKMSLDNLINALSYCKIHNLFTTVIYPEYELESAKQELLDKFDHIRILPLSKANELTEGDMLIVDYKSNKEQFETIPSNNYLNVLLRLKMSQIRDLELIYYNYRDKFCRLTLSLTDIEDADEDALNRYRLDLAKVKDYIYRGWNFDGEFQISTITDRIMLRQMNNCNAGITHFTIAPNGKFYICPGFYIDNPKQSIGSFTETIKILNANLLSIDNASICSSCDCFHCKRCFYLNKKMTLEINTPSHQQCVISHHERNTSGILLEQLQKREMFLENSRIEPLFYLDPFEIVNNKL